MLLYVRPGEEVVPRKTFVVAGRTTVRGIRSRSRRGLVHPPMLRSPCPVHAATVAAVAASGASCCGLQRFHGTSPHERRGTTPTRRAAGESRAVKGQGRWPRLHAARAGAIDTRPFHRAAERDVPARMEPASRSAITVQELPDHVLVHIAPHEARIRLPQHRAASPADHPPPVPPRAPPKRDTAGSSGMSRVPPCGDTAGGAARDQKRASMSAARSGSR